MRENSLTIPGGILSIERIERKWIAYDKRDLLRNPDSPALVEKREGGESRTGETSLTTRGGILSIERRWRA